jgi:hypothetical protein
VALDSFISALRQNDVARQNRFSASITGPAGLAGRAVNLMCEGATFPGQNMRTTADGLRQGPQREIVHGVTYGPISLSFICTNGLAEKAFFETWQGAWIFDMETWTMGYYKDYIGQIVLSQLDRQDSTRYSVTIHEAYPKTIVAQDFNLGNNDSYQTISVEFAFHHWESSSSAATYGGAGTRGFSPSALAGQATSGVGSFIGQLVGGYVGGAVASAIGGSMGGFIGSQVGQLASGFVGGLPGVSAAGSIIAKAGSYTNIAGMATNLASGGGMNSMSSSLFAGKASAGMNSMSSSLFAGRTGNASGVFSNAVGAITANKGGLTRSMGSLDSIVGVRKQAATNMVSQSFGANPHTSAKSGHSVVRGNTRTSGAGNTVQGMMQNAAKLGGKASWQKNPNR